MQKIKRAIVLAAGKGTRLGALTAHTPKPLIDLGGTTPLHRIIVSLEQAGIEEIVINCHHLADQIIDKIKRWEKAKTFNCKLIPSYEESLLETAGGIKKAIHHFKEEPFVIVNGDIVWGGDLSTFVTDLIDNYDDEKMDFLLALTPHEYGPKPSGDFKLSTDGRIEFLSEDESSTNAYCGLAISHPRSFSRITNKFTPLITAWNRAIYSKRFYGFKKDCAWIDMGTPENLERAKKAIKIAA